MLKFLNQVDLEVKNIENKIDTLAAAGNKGGFGD
jgi:hypothetical protein